MGNKCSPELTLAFLLVAALCSEAFMTESIIYYPDKQVNWTEGRQFCQKYHVDMVSWDTVEKLWSAERLNEVWIGLRRDAEQDSVWNWIKKIGEGSSGDNVSQNWTWVDTQKSWTWSWVRNLQPDYRLGRNAECASVNPSTKQWHSNACYMKHQLACYDNSLVVVRENKTWEDALSHCMDMETPCVDSSEPCMYQHELLSLQNVTEYNYVRERLCRATTNEVWTGLRFLAGEWWLVNGQKPEDQGTLPDCPSQWRHCGTLSKYDTANWAIRDCSERRNFICNRFKKSP